MTSSEMDELLGKLKELNYDTYKNIWNAQKYITEFEETEEDIIQGCIQRACSAHVPRWYWKISSEDFEDEPFWASIWYGKMCIDLATDVKGNSPAEALLRAYLAALEAEKREEKKE